MYCLNTQTETLGICAVPNSGFCTAVFIDHLLHGVIKAMSSIFNCLYVFTASSPFSLSQMMGSFMCVTSHHQFRMQHFYQQLCAKQDLDHDDKDVI